MKKVILIQTDVGYYGSVLSAPDLPLGLLGIATSLKHNYQVVICDTRIERAYEDFIRKQLSDGEVICVGITVMLGSSIRQALEISNLVKNINSNIPIIWGGKHPTLAADETIREKEIDILLRGEGEQVFPLLVRALDNKESLRNLPGVSFKENGLIIHNPLALPLDLKTLAPLDYGLIDVRKYQPKMGGRRSLNYETSRGCPVNCPFCYNNLTGPSWRAHSSARVIEDIGFLRDNFQAEHFYFVDDNLFCNIVRLKEIARGFIERNYNITWDTQGACLEDIFSLDEEELSLLRKSGLVRLAIGVQTGSTRIRALLGNTLSDEKIIAVNRKLKAFAIKPHFYFMTGFPGESEEDLSLTVNLALRLLKENSEATTSSFFCFAPWPGTELFRLAEAGYGLKKPENIYFWMKEWDFSQAPWLSGREKKRLHNLFLASIFYDRKSDWYSDSYLIKLIAALYRPIAYLRIKYMILGFMFEAKLIEIGKSALKFFR